MQCPYVNQQISESVEVARDSQAIHFQTHFAGSMEMYSDEATVAQYLCDHQGWFCRCAEPMKTQPIGNNGYILAVGKYGAFGYEVEPKLAVVLDPPVNGVYNTRGIPIPNEPFLGYTVDYLAVMKLQEIPAHQAAIGIDEGFTNQGSEIPPVITRVTWELHMDVGVKFPSFIYKISQAIIRKTGDKLLAHIVRQVSPRLTYKVQQDFHTRFELPLPPTASRTLDRLESGEAMAA